jgi:PAP2 superfamily
MAVTPATPATSATSASVESSANPAAPERAATAMARWRMLRTGSLCAYSGLVIWTIDARGVPFDREAVLAWVCGCLVLVNLGRPWRQGLQVVLDWLPVLAVMLVYDLVRGAADDAGTTVHYRPQLDADRALFGGTVPSVWLQDRFYDGGPPEWWEVIPALVYASHFVVPFVVAGALWQRNRDRWLGYIRRFVSVSFLATLGFLAFPAAPPWLASRRDLLPPLVRTSPRGWSILELDVASRLIDKGQKASNLVAAIPSLHAGYTMLILVFVWPRASRWLRAVMAGYVLAMAFVLVLTAEHYVVDVFAGWAAVAVVCAGWTMWECRAGRRCRPQLTEDEVPEPVEQVQATESSVPLVSR